MWARRANVNGQGTGKYHIFEQSYFVGQWRFYPPLCSGAFVINEWAWNKTQRKQPAHKDRCQRCVAALERREKDEDA